MLAPAPKKNRVPFKYKLVKAVDIAGLNFLAPVIRLCFGEEPRKQLIAIFQFIVVPILAIIAGIMVWAAVADNVVTKSGKLPGPKETLAAASSIFGFHYRENDKMTAFNMVGKAREAKLAEVEKEMADMAPLEAEVNELVAKETAAAEERTMVAVAPLQKKYDELKAASAKYKKEREAELKATASKVGDDKAARDAYIADVREHQKELEKEKLALRELNSEIKEIKDNKDPEKVAALLKQTRIAERRQYLGKMKDQLTTTNRSQKIAGVVESLETQKEDFYKTDADQMYAAATKFVKTESRIDKLESSEYAIPKTLPYQIWRSVLCVFTGFLLGSAIAIPIGVMCGLSKTFMAAMTPIIAIFKPVSPIVWLPVCLIIASAMIPNPDKHWFTQWMWDLPFLGVYKINPAFLASAATVALCSLWATMTNTALGVASVDKDHLNVAKVLKLGFWDRLFKIVLPTALPLVFAGLRISLGVGWMVLIAAELLSSSEGIGKFVWDQFNNGGSASFANMVVVVFVVGLIGLLLDRLMVVLQRLVSFDGSPTAI